MAFSDPQNLPAPLATVLPNTTRGANLGVYTSSDGLTRMTISSAYGKRTRRTVRVDITKITPDPFLPATNVTVSFSFYWVIDLPKAGFSSAEVKAAVTAAMNWATASSGANLDKQLGGES